MRAISWPRFTSELKSANTSFTWPETWEPTGTDTSAFKVPVAETEAVIPPRDTLAVRHWGPSPWRLWRYQV